MFHVINSWLARQVHRYRNWRLSRELAAALEANGWRVRRVALGMYRFRDPRFDALQPPADATTSDVRGWS